MNGAGVPGENRERGTAGGCVGMSRGGITRSSPDKMSGIASSEGEVSGGSERRNIMCEMLKRSLMKCVSVYGKASLKGDES